MEEDNFYTSSERLIKPTEKQQEKAQAEKMAFERERPIIAAVINYLKDEIAYREKIDSIEEAKDPTKFMIEVNTNKQVCSVLRRSLRGLEAKVKKFDKPKKQVAPDEPPKLPSVAYQGLSRPERIDA